MRTPIREFPCQSVLALSASFRVARAVSPFDTTSIVKKVLKIDTIGNRFAVLAKRR
jgi:hypothetical protein